jgi:hypothetical protein
LNTPRYNLGVADHNGYIYAVGGVGGSPGDRDWGLNSVEFLRVRSLAVTVTIDIKPGSDPNSINLCSSGNVPVAILGSESFDPVDPDTGVDPDTITLADQAVRMVGRSGKLMCHEENVDGDGFMDLVCQVPTVDLAVELGVTDTSVDLNAVTFDGIAVAGTDSVRIVKDCP